MVCKECLVYAAAIAGALITATIALHVYSFYNLAREVDKKHSNDLWAKKQAEINAAIAFAQSQRTDPYADYLRRKQIFDSKR